MNIEADADDQEDVEDERLEALEESVRRRALEQLAVAPAVQEGPAHDFDFDVEKVKGCSGAEMKRICDVMRERGKKIRKMQREREELARDLAYNRAKAEHISVLRDVLLSKRICLERMMQRMRRKFRRRSCDDHSDNDSSDNGGDDGADGGAASGGKDNSHTGNDERGQANEGSDTSDESQKQEGGRGEENVEEYGDGKPPRTSKAAGKQVAPSVAVGQRAAQRIVRGMPRRLPSSPMAGPSTRKQVPAAPAILPAWDAAATQVAKASSSLVLPSASAQLQPRRPSPVTPLPRSSAAMRRSMAIAQQWLAGMPSGVARPPSDSSPDSAIGAPSIAGPSQVGTARRASLLGALAGDRSREDPIYGGHLSSTFATPAGEQCVPRARRPPIHNGAKASASATNDKRTDNTYAQAGGAPRRQVYLPPRIPGYDARSVPCSKDDDEKQRRKP
ncbi:hypothetical protein FOMPIDRAFT_159850, partial [Fomitopsis schrenkii]